MLTAEWDKRGGKFSRIKIFNLNIHIENQVILHGLKT